MSFFTSPQQTRESTRAIAGNFGAQAKQQREQKTLEEILAEAQASDNPNAVNDSISKILSQVSPEFQGPAISHLNSISANIAHKKQRKAIENLDIDPDLPIEHQKILLNQRAQAGKPTGARNQFEKKLYEDVFSTLQEAPGVRQNIANLDRLETLSKSLEGVVGLGKAAIGSKDAKEFNALGVAALEAPIKALFKRGVISKEKFKALTAAFVPTASENRLTQQGKIAGLRAFTNEALEKVDRVQNLFDQFGLDIPLEEVYRFNSEANALVDKALDQGANFRSDDVPPSQEGSLASQAAQLNQQQAPPPGQAPLQAAQQATPTEEFEFAPASLTIPRGVAKAAGSTLDFANFLGSLIGPTTIDVAKRTKEAFGEEMNFEELTEKAFDYVTFGLGKPKNPIDRFLEQGVKIGTEFAAPLGLFKAGKPLMAEAAMDGYLAGTALQTAKEAGLGPTAEMASLFLPSFAKNSPALYKKAAEVAQNPAILLEMGKDFANFVKGVPGKALEAAKEIPGKVAELPGQIKKGAEQAFEFAKEKATRPTAKAIKKQLELEPSQVIPKGEARIATKEKQPLSEVFKNERVNALEAKMSQQPEGKAVYEPLFNEIHKENFEKYEKVLANVSKSNPRNFTHQFNTPEGQRDIQQSFWEAVLKENNATRSRFKVDFKKLEDARPKGEKITFSQTKSLVNRLDKAKEELEKGGTVKGDIPAINFLESVKNRLLKPTEQTAETTEKVTKLKNEIKDIEKRIVDKPVFRQSGMGQKEIVQKRKELSKLENIVPEGAEVEEVEKAYRKFNRALNWDKAFQSPDIQKLKLRAATKSTLDAYGKKNPKYGKLFNELNKRYSDKKETILSDMVFDFLHGEDPELVKMWLDKPANVKKFDNMIAETGDIFFKNLGDTVKDSKIFDMVTPKLFTKDLSVKPTPREFTPREKRLLNSLMGDKEFNDLQNLSKTFAKDSEKLNAYLNRSLSGVHVTMDAKKLLKASAFWDTLKSGAALFTGHPIQAIKLAGQAGFKKWGAHQDQILSEMLTDTKFQKVLLEVLRDTEKSSPNFEGINKMAKMLRERGLAISDIGKEESSK
tara:strand:- start:2347 stop:5571 length:3225 start_codon:yes stop_codon:yes gene_type:complete